MSEAKFFPDGTVILAGDPMPDKTIEEMRSTFEHVSSTQELVDTYVQVHNKFGFIEDDIYDYEEGTPEYIAVLAIIDAWKKLYDDLECKVMTAASEKNLLSARTPDSGTVKQLEAFMKKYGYWDGNGWWIKDNDDE